MAQKQEDKDSYVVNIPFWEVDPKNGKDKPKFEVNQPYTGDRIEAYLSWEPHPLIKRVPAPSAGSNNPGTKKDEESA